MEFGMRINPMILNIKLNCNTYICIYSTRCRLSYSPHPPHPTMEPWEASGQAGQCAAGRTRPKPRAVPVGAAREQVSCAWEGKAAWPHSWLALVPGGIGCHLPRVPPLAAAHAVLQTRLELAAPLLSSQPNGQSRCPERLQGDA